MHRSLGSDHVLPNLALSLWWGAVATTRWAVTVVTKERTGARPTRVPWAAKTPSTAET